MAQWIIVIIAFIGNLLLGLTTLLKNHKSSTSRWFGLFSFLFGTYIVFNQFSVTQTQDDWTFFWIRAVITIAPAIVFVFFALVHVFPRTSYQLPTPLLLGAAACMFALMILGQTTYIFSGVVPQTNRPIPGPLIGIFVAYNFIFIGWAIVVLLRKYFRATGREKVQLRYFLYGAITMFTLILLTNVVFVVFLNIATLVIMVPVYTLIFNAAIAYAIIRHRFMDIRLILARSISYIVLVIFIAALYSGTIYGVSQLFLNFTFNTTQFAVLTFMSVLVALSFNSIRRNLERYTDTLLFKDRYDTDELLDRLNKIMASTIQLETLVHQLLEIITKELRVTKATVILLEEDEISDILSEGHDEKPVYDEEEIKQFIKTRTTLIFDDMEDEGIKELMRKYELAAIVHMRTEGKQVGLLCLGSKSSGDIFSAQDLQFLEIFGPAAAVALQNAKAYEEIRRFNITLQEKIDRATSDLTSANEKLTELDKLKDEFVSLASHELRTPMTAIKGSLSTILDGYAGDISKESRDFLTAAYNENDRLIRLVNNLLNISRIEAGRFTFTVTSIDLDKMATEVVNNLQMAAKEKNIYLKYVGDGPIPAARGDEDKVKEVFINLIGNALKFAWTGGVTVGIVQKDGGLVVSVSDTGPGITKEDQDLLFKKFSQARQGYTKQTGGTGLGLYISKQIIEGLGGKIWLESEIGKGSTFYFTLPKAS